MLKGESQDGAIVHSCIHEFRIVTNGKHFQVEMWNGPFESTTLGGLFGYWHRFNLGMIESVEKAREHMQAFIDVDNLKHGKHWPVK